MPTSLDDHKDRMFKDARAVDPSGNLRVIGIGRKVRPLKDLYHFLLTTSWPRFLTLILGVYLAANLLFATLYRLGGDCIHNAQPGSFVDAFFFSVQTLSTIGYGFMAPRTGYAHLIVTVETFLALLGVALLTGLMFAKFSRPTARVLFTENAVIARRDGRNCLMIRLANERTNQMLDATVKVILVTNGRTEEGEFVRRFHRLTLTRPDTPLFALTWTVVHVIDEESPLHGLDHAALEGDGAALIVVVTGIDDTLSQPISARRSYIPSEIIWGQRFADVLCGVRDGHIVADFRRFHDLVPDRPGTAPA
jgi:inward rectifier potassium channel